MKVRRSTVLEGPVYDLSVIIGIVSGVALSRTHGTEMNESRFIGIPQFGPATKLNAFAYSPMGTECRSILMSSPSCVQVSGGA